MTSQASSRAAAWDASAAFFMQVSGIRLRVRVSGSGPPLMLLMGIGANIEMWQPLAKDLAGRELIAYDVPGAGGSGAPRWPLGMGQHAKVAGKLLDRLGYSTVDVLGVSWGGLLAQKFAITQPARVRRLVLAATMPGVGSALGRPSALRVLMTPRRYYSREYFNRVAADLYGGRVRTHPESVSAEIQYRLARPPSPTGYLAQIAATWTYSGFPILHRIQAPTLIMAGDDDPIVPLVNAHLLKWLIPEAELSVVRGGGHLFLLDGTRDVASTITRFLDQQ
jgi:poly(3-hydroxyalkanoate) depolymerase